MKSSGRLVACFLEALPPGVVPPREAPLEELVAGVVERGHSAWPELTTSSEKFVAHLSARVPVQVPLTDYLENVHAGDLYLACACACGESDALEVLEARYLQSMASVLEKLDVGSGVGDETLQRVRQWLVVGRGGGGAKLGDYAGRGSLLSWLRVIVVREALALGKRRRREIPLGDSRLLADTAEGDPELEYVKSIYRPELKVVFQEALATLSTRERNLLRHQLLDGLSVTQLGALYGIHRATAARRLARIREKLLRETRNRLAARLGASRSTVESIMRLVHTRLDMSIQRFLGPLEE